jgi:2-isopropylmalate synthase
MCSSAILLAAATSCSRRVTSASKHHQRARRSSATSSTRIKEREHAGLRIRSLPTASLALVIRKAILEHNAEPLVHRGRVPRSPCAVTARRIICEAIGEGPRRQAAPLTRVADGDGPVNALDAALRLALARFFPRLEKVQLVDYKVRILDGASGTAAKTRVLITSTDGKREWGTVGVSENIIDASLQALVDSMEYALLRK